jgi:hypothetical protein
MFNLNNGIVAELGADSTPQRTSLIHPAFKPIHLFDLQKLQPFAATNPQGSITVELPTFLPQVNIGAPAAHLALPDTSY